MGFLLIIITWILTPFLELGNFITGLWVYRKNYQFLKFIDNFFTQGAIDRDRFGNHNFKTGLNFWFSKSNSGFGDKEETISSALGRRRLANDLGLWGWFWYGFLYGVDYKNWNNGGHCIASIKKEI
jgi:hypothetical protein